MKTVIKVGNHVTTTIATGDVNTTNANITLRAKEVLLDSGTHISAGTEPVLGKYYDFLE